MTGRNWSMDGDEFQVLVNGLPEKSRKLYTTKDLLVIEWPFFPR